mgnify:CR=1 FL=1
MDEIDGTTEKVSLIEFEESHKNIHASGNTRNDSDEEEDDEGGHPNVGC